MMNNFTLGLLAILAETADFIFKSLVVAVGILIAAWTLGAI